MTDIVEELLNEPEWCLHCGTDDCEHAARHNRAYGIDPMTTDLPEQADSAEEFFA